MPYKDPEKQKAAGARWYQNNKKLTDTRTRENRRRRRDKLSDYVDEIKTSVGCIECGEANACCLDFHHVDAADKKFSISDLVSGAPKNKWGELNDEIVKCIAICRNHHAMLHAELISVSKRRITDQLRRMKKKMKELTNDQTK